MKHAIDSMGFANGQMVKLARVMIGTGAVTASVGAFVVAAGLVMIAHGQEWVTANSAEMMDTVGQMYTLSKVCKQFDDGVVK